MNLLVALESACSETAADYIRRALPSFAVSVLTDATELSSLLASEPYEIIVLGAAIRDALDSQSRELLADSFVILVVSDLAVAHQPGHGDFLLARDCDVAFLAELELRVRMAQTRFAMSIQDRQTHQAVTRALEVIVYRLDSEGRFTYVNEAALAYGYDPADLVGHHFSELLDTDTARGVSRAVVLPRLKGTTTGISGAPKLFDERRRGDRCTRGLEIAVRGSGPLRETQFIGLVTASGDVVTRVDGVHEVVGTIGVIRDATRSGRASDTLRKLFTMAETAPYGLLVVDPSMRVDYANPGFYRTFALTPADVLNREIASIELPGFDAELEAAFRRSCDAGSLCERDLTLLAADRVTHRFRLTGRPVFDGEQQCVGSIVSIVPSEFADSEAVVHAGDSASPIVRELVERVTQSFRDEALLDPGISVFCISTRAVAPQLALLTRDVIHDLLEFAVYTTGGGPIALRVDDRDDLLSIEVAATVPPASDGESGGTTAARGMAHDASRVRALVNRSERLRSDVLRAGGEWNVNRRPEGATFTVVLPPGAVEEASAPVVHTSGFNIESFLAGYDDSPEVLDEIIALFCTEAPLRAEVIRTALVAGEFERIVPAAHSLANTSGTLQSHAAVASARELEKAARARDLPACTAAARTLIPLIESMVTELKRIRADRASNSG